MHISLVYPNISLIYPIISQYINLKSPAFFWVKTRFRNDRGLQTKVMDTLRKRQDQEWRQDLAEMNRPWLPWETMKIITGYFMGISMGIWWLIIWHLKQFRWVNQLDGEYTTNHWGKVRICHFIQGIWLIGHGGRWRLLYGMCFTRSTWYLGNRP